jgi:FkbM family methyltransferase
LVGPNGRVIAIEPVPESFALLAANVQLFKFNNVTLMNVAASDKSALVGMDIPYFKTGLRNLYEARLTTDSSHLQGLWVVTLLLDSLALPNKVALVKIDTEGHELQVLRGMAQLLHRDHPTLIVETNSSEVSEFLNSFGYVSEKLAKSPNTVFRQAYTHEDSFSK